MLFLNLFCYSLTVAVVASGVVIDGDLDEYRLAPKRYHRKIRSREGEENEHLIRHQSDEEPTRNYDFPSAEQPVTAVVTANTSFLLDLPYPSHFLVSLQMLNLSLPFIDTSAPVPEDPPTPEFDLNQVIKNRQYLQRPEENQEITGGDVINTGRRRPLNRIRHRIPARRLPKRSADDRPIHATAIKFRNWNASNLASNSRRQELYSNSNKVRYIPTIRPIKKFQSKLLHRRANATKFDNRKYLPSSTTVESTTESPPTTPDQAGASTDQPESSDISGSSDQFVFQQSPSSVDFESFKTRMGGFRPIRPNKPAPINADRFGVVSDKFRPREKFIDSPPQHFVPIIPAGNHYDRTTTESFPGHHYDFPPPATGHLKPTRQSTKYISQFNSSPAHSKEKQHGIAASEEVTQIQKPETTDKNKQFPSTDSNDANEFLVSATSTIVPVTDFPIPNLNFPSFELPSDGPKSETTLPPPLSIEELIKKFTGKELVTDSPSASSTPPSTHPPQIKATKSTTTTVDKSIASDNLEDLEASLKQLLVVTTSSAQILNNSRTSVPPPSSSTVSGSGFSQLTIPPPNSATEKTIFETTVATKPLLPSGSEISKSTDSPSPADESINTTELPIEQENQPISVQRGPLDVSSFDGNFGSSAGIGQQGGFNFPQQQQQQQFQPGNFGGFSNGQNFGGGGDFTAGQQNPYFYGAGLFTGSGGQGQFQNQNGFDGTLHYSPTGPPAGEFNAITQGLSLLASFGGPGGGQFAIQQPSGFQQQSFNDFNPASLQGSPQFQSPAAFPSQGFSSFPQGYPSFNLAQQQPQTFSAQPQSPYHVSQIQNFPQQQQQFFAPVQQQQQQQPFQFGGINSGPGLHPAAQQFQPGSTHQSAPGSAPYPTDSSNQAAINPSQFGTLLSNYQPSSSSSSFDPSGFPAGTASITSGPPSSGGDSSSSAIKEKAADTAAASRLVEIRLRPVSHSLFADQEAEASQSVQLISIGNYDSDSKKTLTRKSLYTRGLRSGYYS